VAWAMATSLAEVTPRSTPIVVIILTTPSSITNLHVESWTSGSVSCSAGTRFEVTNTTLVAKPRDALQASALEPGRPRPWT